MVALGSVGDGVPLKVQAALETALEASLAKLPALEGTCRRLSGRVRIDELAGDGIPQGRVVQGAVHRCCGARSRRRCCAGTAGPVAAVRAKVVPLKAGSFARVAANAAKLASIGGGGTNVSAPLARLNAEGAEVDLVVIVSDNESWIDATRHGATATMGEWERLKKRCPAAKLVCIDLQPYGTTQAKSRRDILNVGGFSDSVFETISRFAAGDGERDWVAEVNEMEV
jgi:60 kDa SS-A/Ro ribonucleoprotein